MCFELPNVSTGAENHCPFRSGDLIPPVSVCVDEAGLGAAAAVTVDDVVDTSVVVVVDGAAGSVAVEDVAAVVVSIVTSTAKAAVDGL